MQVLDNQNILEVFEFTESTKSKLMRYARNVEAKNFIESAMLKEARLFSYALKNFSEEQLEKLVNEDFPLLDKIKGIGSSVANSIADKFKNVSISSMLDKIQAKIDAFKGDEPDATIMKAMKEKAVAKYQELRKMLGGSNALAVTVLIGALILWMPPVIGTPIVFGYFKAIKAIAEKVASGKDVSSAMEI